LVEESEIKPVVPLTLVTVPPVAVILPSSKYLTITTPEPPSYPTLPPLVLAPPPPPPKPSVPAEPSSDP